MKTLAMFALLLSTCSVGLAQQCPQACQQEITALSAKVDALQKQLASLPLAQTFDVVPTLQQNQYQATVPIDAKTVLVHVWIDGVVNTATLLPPAPLAINLAPPHSDNTFAILQKTCPGQSTNVTVTFDIDPNRHVNVIRVEENQVNCGVATVHVFLLLHP